jgi:hypothetical protein
MKYQYFPIPQLTYSCGVQELLQLFGVPWIVSPTEAEAQCAFLGKPVPVSSYCFVCIANTTGNQNVRIFERIP